MFRARPGGVWHFCENCSHWPLDYQDFDDDFTGVGRLCMVCLRLYDVDECNCEEPAYSVAAQDLRVIIASMRDA